MSPAKICEHCSEVPWFWNRFEKQTKKTMLYLLEKRRAVYDDLICYFRFIGVLIIRFIRFNQVWFLFQTVPWWSSEVQLLKLAFPLISNQILEPNFKISRASKMHAWSQQSWRRSTRDHWDFMVNICILCKNLGDLMTSLAIKNSIKLEFFNQLFLLVVFNLIRA